MEGIYKFILCIHDMDKCCVEALAKIVAYVFMHENFLFGNYKNNHTFEFDLQERSYDEDSLKKTSTFDTRLKISNQIILHFT